MLFFFQTLNCQKKTDSLGTIAAIKMQFCDDTCYLSGFDVVCASVLDSRNTEVQYKVMDWEHSKGKNTFYLRMVKINNITYHLANCNSLQSL